MKAHLLGIEARNRLREFPQFRGPEIDLSSIIVCDRIAPRPLFSLYDKDTTHGFAYFGKHDEDYRKLAQYMATYSLIYFAGTATEKDTKLILIMSTEVAGCEAVSGAKERYDRTMACAHQMVGFLKQQIATYLDLGATSELLEWQIGAVRRFLHQPERIAIILADNREWIDTSEKGEGPFVRDILF